jgi:EmrB/QacA subfamily drug resistance transporter
MATTTNNRINKWWALLTLCLGTLMIVLDTTIVNVALPAIKSSLGFSESSLAWVVNAYLLTFGGFLMLGGRLGDLYGPRKLFLNGLVLFTLASLACGLSTTQFFLIAARAIQGIGGAIVSAVSLSIMMNLFTEPSERAKAMGYFGFVAAGGGSVGVLLGGILTGAINWHAIFLVNIPIGILVFLLSLRVLPATHLDTKGVHLDLWGAVTLTAALMLAVFAIVNGNAAGWLSLQTVSLLVLAVILVGVFVRVESKTKSPLIPLDLFKLHNLRTANIIGVLWAAAMFASFFIAALFLQLVLGYSSLQVGLAFVPTNVVMAIFSFSLSAWFVTKFGIKRPLSIGLFLAACGLFLFARMPLQASFIFDILPGMLLLGIGAGIAFNPMLLAAMNDVDRHESGIASGIVNTSFMMGGALGLAILASIAASRTISLLASGSSETLALASGYHMAFLGGGVSALVATLLTVFVLRSEKQASSPNTV